MQRDGRLHTFDHKSIQRALHSHNGFGPVVSMRDEFGDKRIVIGRNYGVRITSGIDANSRPAGNAECRDLTGRGRKSIRVFRIDPAFDGVPSKFDGREHFFEPFAGSHSNLRFHQIYSGHHLRHRMLHLNARIHLNEI